MEPTMEDFTRIYDSFLATVRSGTFADVSAFFPEELRSEIKTPEDQEEFMMMAKLLAPASYEPLFLTMAEEGQKAEVQIIATLKIPEEIQQENQVGPTQRLELMLNFFKEGGQWKWGAPTILGNPDERARPKDLDMGSRHDYNEGSNMQLAGQILSVQQQADGTVFLLRVLDEEIAAFIPAALVSSEFVPGRVLVLQGAEHRSDKLKFWADEASLHQR